MKSDIDNLPCADSCQERDFICRKVRVILMINGGAAWQKFMPGS
ncbi:hypothetical protein CAter10_1613 [Collimonas arenae]|nr:hypothetical protein CAter10_1613 [Collimonas arenae]